MVSALAAVAIGSVALNFGACGSDGGEPAPPAENGGHVSASSGLTKYLPADSVFIRVVDLKAVGEQLGLPAGTDPFIRTSRQTNLNDPQAQLALAAAAGFGPYEQQFTFPGQPNPVVGAFDGPAITEAVSTFLDTDHPVSAIRTSQPFSEIASSLEKAGFERHGAALEAVKPTRTQYSSVANAGNGVIVVAANEADAADLAASPPGGPSTLEQLIAPSDEPIAVAVTQANGECVKAFGGWNAPDGTGVMRFSIEGGAESDAIDLDALAGTPITPGTPEVQGDTIEVPFTKSGSNPLSAASPLQDVIVKVAIGDLYQCPIAG